MAQKPTYEELEQRVQELEKAGFERQLEEKALQEQVVHHRVLMDESLDGIAIIDQKHRVVESNKRFAEMLGYTPEELVHLHTWDWEAIITEAEIRSNFADLTKTKTTFETRHRRKDGTIYDAEVTACGAKLGDESMVLTITRDITDRKRAEEALREAHNIINRSPAVAFLWEIAAGWPVEFVSDNVNEIFGYKAEEFTSGKISYAEVVHPDDLERVGEEIKTFRKKEGRESFTHNPYRIVTKDGEIKWLEDMTFMRRDKKGNITHFEGIVLDVTERVLTEEALRASEDKFRSFAEQSLVGIYLISDDVFKYVNPKFAEIFGYSVDECLDNMFFRQLVHPEDLATVQKQVGRRLSGETKAVRYSFRGIKKSGETIHVEIFGSSMFLKGKTVATGTMLDITAPKRAQEALLKQTYFLQKAQEIGQIGSWELDVKKNELSWTYENYRIFGLPVGTKLTYETFLSFVHPDDRGYVDTTWKSAFNKKPYDIEHRILIDGRVKWVREKAELEFNEKDECIRGIGFTQDITFRKHLEEQLTHQLSVLTQPEVEFDDLSLTDILEVATLQHIQDAFSEAFNMPSIIYGPDGKPLTRPSKFTSFCRLVRSTEKGASQCELFDKSLMDYLSENPNPHIRTGCFIRNMLTGTVPIVIQGRHLANWGIGQMVDCDLDIDEIQTHALTIGVDGADLINAARDLKTIDEDSFERVVKFLKTLSDQISLLGLYNLQQGREISNRIKIEETLREKEQLYRSMFEQNNAMKLLIDPEFGNIIDANSAACKFYHYNHEDISRLHIWDINTLGEVETRERMNQVMLGKETEFEFTHQLSSGETRDVLVYSNQLEIRGKNLLYSVIVDITDRKQAAKKIKQNADNLRIVFDSAPNILALVNKDVGVEMINRNGALLVGKGKEALSGLLCGDVFNCKHAFHGDGCGTNPECPDCPLRPRVLSTFATGKPHIEEEGRMTFILNGKEVVVDILISTSLLDISDNKKVLLSLTDISENKNAIRGLRESEEKFRLAFHTSPDSINLNRLEDGTYLEINQGFTQITGYTREEAVGKTSLELNVWKYPAERERLIEGLKEQGYVENMEAEFVAKDGSIRYGLISARTLKFKNENVIISIIRDNTERKLSERELERSEEQHRSIIQTAMDGFWLTDINGKILEINQTYCQMSGYGQDELLAMRIKDLEVRETEVDISERIKKIALVGEDRFESQHRRKNGEIFDVEVRVQYRDDDGGRYICFLRDITGQNQLEAQIQQAQKMESIGNLAGGIAHDFNNILFPIVGFAEMLTGDLPQGSPERVKAQQILHAGNRGAELVKQILAFSRQHEHKLMPTRVQQVMKEVLKLSRASIPMNIEINHDLQPECGIVLADATQLHQIGMNLITNAYHAVEDKEGQISVQVKEVVLVNSEAYGMSIEPDKYAMLSVSDNGIGIPPANLKKIFDPYFTTKEQGKGTGLGLAVVFGIIKKHKGGIKVRSEIGKGTTFEVYLPLMPAPEESHPDGEHVPVKGGIEHILLIDDELAVAQLEKHMLERLGYKVNERTSSADALEAFRNCPDSYDLVITDMSMPNMTGEQLAREMLTIRPGLPIIICTGFSERIDERKANSIGIKGFLMKPVLKSDMAAMVRKVLDEAVGSAS